MFKNAFLHSISCRDGWILTKFVEIYNLEMQKNRLDFSNLDPVPKVTGGQRMIKNGLSALYLLNEWMDFERTFACTISSEGLDGL